MNWEENVRKVEPYVAGEQPKQKDIIKLNTNECPYPPAPGVVAAVQRMAASDFRLYPDMNAEALVEELASYYQVKPEQIFVGVGSDDVLSMSFLTFFNGKLPILFPDVTYSFYDVWAELYRIPYTMCPLDENLRIRKEDYLKPNGGIILANPNAPTGVFESVELLEEIVAANQDSVVIVDEAYVDFGGVSMMPLIHKYNNLMVVQTFSKSRAMAGMRIGFAVANEKMINFLKDAKFSFNSYTMNRPSIELGTEAVKDEQYFRETVNKIVKTREWAKEQMARLGFSFTDSKSNFLFVTHKQISAREIFEALKANNIYVRYWNKPRIDNYLRITVGTDEEMQILIQFLEKYIKEKIQND